MSVNREKDEEKVVGGRGLHARIQHLGGSRRRVSVKSRLESSRAAGAM